MSQNDTVSSETEIFRIIIHGSPPVDSGFRYWTEAPECPAAHDGGKTADEAVSRTKDRIEEWSARRADGANRPRSIEFVVQEAL